VTHCDSQACHSECDECDEPLRDKRVCHSLAAWNPLEGGIPRKAARQSVSLRITLEGDNPLQDLARHRLRPLRQSFAR